MQLAKLLTYSFDKNVGTADRVLRIAVGIVFATFPWLIASPQSVRFIAAIVGAMIFITGIVSRCGLYYMLGYRTCPISGKPNPSINRH